MKGSILVVENDHTLRTMVAETLEDEGYPVFEAANANDAMRMLERYPSIELLFTDIEMPPGANGYVLADMAVTRWPRLHVLYTTGGACNLGSLPGYLHGEILEKNYHLAQMIDTVARSLAQPRPSCDGRGRNAADLPLLYPEHSALSNLNLRTI